MARTLVGAVLAAVILLTGCSSAAPNQPTAAERTAVAALPGASSASSSLAAAPPASRAGGIPSPVPSPPPTAGGSPAATPPATAKPSATPTSGSDSGSTPSPSYDPNAPKADPSWPGQYSVYRAHTHSVQKTDWYCVPTSIQMMLNIINGDSDTSEAGQRRYWEYAQAHSKYPVHDNGADPQGWVEALDNWGVHGYSVGVSGSMQDALWLAAKRMRLTDRPVGLIVWGDSGTGGHAWVMTGFESTDDPKDTDNYAVTSIQAMGSLWPYGTINGKPFDPGPRQWVGYRELRQKFTRLNYRAAPAWDGQWITVVP